MLRWLICEKYDMTETNDQLRTRTAAAARDLLDTWERLASTHKVLGGSCSCGAHGLVVHLSDFEQDIGDHLRGQGEQHQRRDVLRLLETHARVEGRWSIAGFLETMADASIPMDGAAAAFVLERLPRTVLSFEDLHRRR